MVKTLETKMDETSTQLQRVEAILKPWSSQSNTPEPNRIDFVLAPDQLTPAIARLRQERWGYLSAITGLDNERDGLDFEVLYHFCNGPTVATLRVPLPRENPAVPSLCEIIPAASVHERELMEMFGVDVTDIPDARHLFLPDVWPDETYPLRKDFDKSQMTPKRPETIANGDNSAPNRFVVPIGPQHPALKEPAHFEFTVDGEIVTEASVRLGYAHRGIEKATESRNWTQNLYLLERVCGICSHIHAMAYCLGVEKLAGVSAPPRAQAIREIIASLERIHSHMLWLGVAAHEAGFDTLFMYSWRDRESVMDLLEDICGNRVNYSANVIGGVKFDITSEQTDMARATLEFLDKRLYHYLDVVTSDAAFTQRTRGVGVMDMEEAELLGAVGPTARASGVKRDIRVEAPYSAYTTFPIHAIVDRAGDLEARFVVRLKELLETNRIIRDILDNIPDGDLTVRVPRKIKAGETISRVEAPRGELFYFIKSDGGDQPARVKIRTPTICNMAMVLVVAIGQQLADMPMILTGVDPCFSCNDRAVIVRCRNRWDVWSWERLRQHGIERYR